MGRVYELVYEGGDGARLPVSDELLAGGGTDDRAKGLRALRLLAAFEWGRGGTPPVDLEKLGDGLWVLKAKPGCWRIIFYPLPAEGAYLLLHGTCKKKWKRNPNDKAKAATRLQDYRAGRARRSAVSL